jgi:hypothetical protein
LRRVGDRRSGLRCRDPKRFEFQSSTPQKS